MNQTDSQPHIYLTPVVLNATREEALSVKGKDETGGLWLGHYTNVDYWVAGHIGPGPNARRTPVSFMPDSAFQNVELARRGAENPGEQLIAMWHRHPGRMDYPSGTDVAAAESVIDTWNMPRPEVVVGIAITPDRQFGMRTWRMTAQDRVFREVAWSATSPVETPVVRESALPEWLDLEDGRRYLRAMLESADSCGFQAEPRRENGAIRLLFSDGAGHEVPLLMPEGFPFAPAWLLLGAGRQRIAPDLTSGPRLLRRELRRLCRRK